MLWAAMVLLDDQQWQRVSGPEIPSDGGAVVTGDPVVDRWERELAAND